MPRDLEALTDMQSAISEALAFVENMTAEQFQEDRKTQLAILHLITLIGESARRTSAAFRVQHAELPWPQIMGMRNRLVHEYDDVDLWMVWNVLENDLPVLLKQILALIPPSQEL